MTATSPESMTEYLALSDEEKMRLATPPPVPGPSKDATEAEVALKPCPFCGGEAAFGIMKFSERSETAKMNGQAVFHGVNCIVCSASTLGVIGAKTKAQAAERWNMRTP